MPSRRSQASTSTNKASQSTLEQTISRSQLSEKDKSEATDKCVRYIIYHAGNNLPIRRAELQKHACPNAGKDFENILASVTQTLKNVYGFDLYLSTDSTTKSKQYLLSNALPYQAVATDEEEISENSIPEDVHIILIMLVLMHVFMSNDCVTDASLFSFLRSIKLDPDRKHKLFGNIKDFVTVKMVKQKYLITGVEEISRNVIYSWGPRAEHEISKHELLKFVCKVYKDRSPKSWLAQFENADKQFPSNTSEDVEMVEDDD